MGGHDYILVDTGLNYVLIGRYKNVPSAGILIDKPIFGTFAEHEPLVMEGELPIGMARLSLSEAYQMSKRGAVARFEDGKCVEFNVDYEEELSEYASIRP